MTQSQLTETTALAGDVPPRTIRILPQCDVPQSALESLQAHKSLPIELAKLLDQELRQILCPDDQQQDLFHLLQEAEQTAVLSPDAATAAHIIRKQRNSMAHEEKPRETYMARALLSLFAASLVWPELSRASAEDGSSRLP